MNRGAHPGRLDSNHIPDAKMPKIPKPKRRGILAILAFWQPHIFPIGSLIKILLRSQTGFPKPDAKKPRSAGSATGLDF